MKRLLALFLTLAMATAAYAHNGMQHVMGTIATMSATSLQVKATTGKLTTVLVNQSTKWMQGSSAITSRDVRVGERVVIHAKPVDGKLIAAEVEVGAAPAH